MKDPFFIISDPGYEYSRPCFNGAGDTIIFMRKGTGTNPPPIGLFTVPAFVGPRAQPSLYYQPERGTINATRPDWCWDNGKVAFTGIPVEGKFPPGSWWVIDGGPNSHARNVRIVPAVHLQPTRIDGKHNYKAYDIEYPSWYPDGISVSATNYGPYQAIRMSTQTGHFSTLTALSPPTTESGNANIWVGMTSASRGEGNPIAFAGQRPSQNYEQDSNRIWIKETDKDPYLLEGPNAPQGRAPWFSPSGNRIVFESDRLTNANYQLFISNFPGGQPVEDPLTPATWFSQHAKWSPDGNWLTFYGYNTETKEKGICLLQL